MKVVQKRVEFNEVSIILETPQEVAEMVRMMEYASEESGEASTFCGKFLDQVADHNVIY